MKTKKAKSCKSHVARSVKSRNLKSTKTTSMKSSKMQNLKGKCKKAPSQNANCQLTSNVVGQPKLMRLHKTTSFLFLNEIKPRPKGDLRVPQLSSIYEMAISIDDVNCTSSIHDISVDCMHRLISGKTRYLAMQVLSTKKSERANLLQKWIANNECIENTKLSSFDFKHIRYCSMCDKIPVSVFEFDSAKDHDCARAIEIAENDCRKKFDYDAIINRYKELLNEGYVDEPHVHEKGAKSAQQQLVKEFHCNIKTVQRALACLDSASSKCKDNSKKPSPKQIASKLKREFTHLEKISKQEAMVETLGKKDTLKFWRSIRKLASGKVLELKAEESD